MDQAPLLMEFPKQEHWSGVPFLPLGDLPNSGIEPLSLCLLHWQADFFLTTSTTWDVCVCFKFVGLKAWQIKKRKKKSLCYDPMILCIFQASIVTYP